MKLLDSLGGRVTSHPGWVWLGFLWHRESILIITQCRGSDVGHRVDILEVIWLYLQWVQGESEAFALTELCLRKYNDCSSLKYNARWLHPLFLLLWSGINTAFSQRTLQLYQLKELYQPMWLSETCFSEDTALTIRCIHTSLSKPQSLNSFHIILLSGEPNLHSVWIGFKCRIVS